MTVSTTDAAAPPHASNRLAGLSWAHFLNDGAANYLPGVLPAILLQLHLSAGLAGGIMAALLIGQGLQPFVGLLSDRIGGRTLIVLGLFGSSLGAALVGITDSVAGLVAVLLLIGLSNALFHPQALAGVRRLATAGQGTALSIFLVGGEIGRGLWPALASMVVVSWGRSSLWLLALPALVTLPLLWRWAPALPRRRPDAGRIDWRRHARPLTLLVAFSALRASMIFTATTFMPVLWVGSGGSLTVGASLITMMFLVGIIGNLAGGRLGDRMGTRPVLVIAMTVATVALLAFLQTSGVWLWFACAILGIGVFATLPLTILVAQDILPENRSFGSGLALGLANALGAIGLLLLSPLAEWGGPALPLWAATVCGAATVLLALVIPNHGAHHGEPDSASTG